MNIIMADIAQRNEIRFGVFATLYMMLDMMKFQEGTWI